MKKRIMILGAGRGQVDLIKTAKKMGYYTVVASIDGDYPGFKYADYKCICDISCPEEVDANVKSLNIDGIATACLDTGIAALGYACDKNNLIGLSEMSAKMSGDKLKMKTALVNGGVNTARYVKVSSEDDLENVINSLNFPVITKAVDLQGSRGINIADNKEKLRSCYNSTMSETKNDFCIIEEFIDGYEFGAQAFVVDGEILFVCPAGDLVYRTSTNVPVGHYIPLDLPGDILEQIQVQAKRAVKALGLDNCAVNIDFIIKDNTVYVIELTGRIGANCLPDLISVYYGVDIYYMIIETAMGNGQKVKDYFYSANKPYTPCFAKMLFSEKSGFVKKISCDGVESDNLVGLDFFVSEGKKVNKFTNSKDCVGQVIVKGSTLSEAKEYADFVTSNILIDLEDTNCE